MPKHNVIRVYEYETVQVEKTDGFKREHLDTLIKFNEKKENYNKYFTLTYNGIRFKEYVGVLRVGNLTIEVLPKADKNADEGEKQNWRNVLLQMLKECSLLQVNHVDYATLSLKSNSILDIYLELFINEAETLLHEGLLKKYKKTEGNQTALKGQLIFSEHINQNITHQERFYVRYNEYNRDNIFNQILYKTLCLIPLISNNSFIADRVKSLKTDFPEVSNYVVTAKTFERLDYDRKTERYKVAMLISKMLLLNYRPDIKGGNENVIAILFDMNKLWEEFVYRRLKKEEKNGITVHRQQSANFWKAEETFRSKTIRPDIVIKHNNETIVLDTKWKIVEDLIPSDEDLKQMFVYNLYWKCDRSILLYPASEAASNSGEYHDYKENKNFINQCTIETITVLNKDTKAIEKQFGKVLLKKLRN